MIIQETEEIVKFTDVRSPSAWRVFWRRSSILLPLWVFSAVCVLEIIGFSAWRFGRSVTEILLPLIVLASVMCLPFALLACTTFQRRPSRQIMEMGSEGIKSLDGNPKVVPWERVGKLCLSKLPGVSGFSVFSIGYARAPGTSFLTKPIPGLARTPPNKRRSRDLTWMRLALLNPEQTQPMRNGLDLLRKDDPRIPELRVLRSTSIAGLWLLVLAMYLLLHGMPLLGVGLEKHHQRSNAVEEVAPAREDKMATVVVPMLARHFRNEHQFRMFFIVTGASLTLAGIGTYAASFLVMRRDRGAMERSNSAVPQSVRS
jgi:hypothetical protein